MRNIVCAAAFLLLQAPFAQAAESAPSTDAAALKEARQAVTAVLSRIDSALAQAAPKTAADPAGTLEGLRQGLPVATCAVMDRQGKLTAVAPKENERFVGTDISKQDHAVKLLKSHKPVMGEVFTAVEGFVGVGIYRPLFSGKKEFAGGVGVLVKPEDLLAAALDPLQGKDGRYFWVMDTSGRVLYDADKPEIGKMIFSDPLYSPYPELLALGKRIAARAQGRGEYKFSQTGGKEVVAKSALWDTVGLHGARWRLVLARPK
ncbi:MAG: cache domain-containing protein [Elusimicrobia bacterium]|nr:cache domain-containing protein [Elusimicrobiota bacterium]